MSCKMVGEVVHLESWREGKGGVDRFHGTSSQWKWAPGFGQQEVNQTGGGTGWALGGGVEPLGTIADFSLAATCSAQSSGGFENLWAANPQPPCGVLITSVIFLDLCCNSRSGRGGPKPLCLPLASGIGAVGSLGSRDLPVESAPVSMLPPLCVCVLFSSGHFGLGPVLPTMTHLLLPNSICKDAISK